MEIVSPVKRKAARRPNGHGSVFFSDRLDRWVGMVSLGDRRKSIYGPRGDQSARAKVGVEERMRPLLGLRSTNSRDLGTAIRAYVASDHLSPATIALYTTAAKHIIGGEKRNADPIARMDLLDIEPADIRAFYARLETRATMKQKVHVLLHRVLEEAVRMESIWRNPASHVPKPRAKRKEPQVWTPVEVARFLKAARGHRLYAVFLLSLTSTMGPAELFGLKRDDLHLDDGYLIVQRNLVSAGGHLAEKSTKTTKRRRRIDLPRVTIEALRRRLAIAQSEGHGHARYVFTSDDGGPIRIDNFRKRVWAPLVETAKVPYIPLYGMRHTANALMGHLGVPIAVAQQRMGHESIKTTVDVYGHLYEGAGKDAAHKLDAFLRAKP